MCVYNDLFKQAIFSSEDIFINFTRPLVQGNAQQYLNLREQIVNFVFYVQDEIKPQFSAIENDRVLKGFYLYHKGKLDKLREVEQKFRDSTEDKKGEILQEEKKLLNEVITHSLQKATNTIDKIEQTEFMKKYFESLYGGFKNWQGQDVINNIYYTYAEDFQKIERYEKKLDECKYYEGFYFHTIGKWNFSIFDENNHKIIYHESPMLCLHQKEENDFYPYEYMIVCVDLEMEYGGSNEIEAYENMKNSCDFYLKNMFKTKNDLDKFTQIVEKKSIWKDTFYELSGIGKDRRNVHNKDYEYSWTLDAGVSNG